MEPVPTDATDVPAPAGRLAQAWAHLTRFLPWFSLVTSVVGAVSMNRSESRAELVALGSAASWVVLVVLMLAHKATSQRADDTGALRKVLRFTTTAASQSLIQLSLFFSAPFYVDACVWSPAELVFAASFAIAAGIALWDPACTRVLREPLFGPLLLAFSSFVAWNAALPMLGVPHRIAVWAAAGAVAVAVPIVSIMSGALGLRRLASLVAGAAVPIALALGAVRAIPPAPLRVVAAGIGTRIENRELVDPSHAFPRSPGVLLCWTAIRAPHGLADELTHEWWVEGKLTNRIALDVRGGRRAGFRTWSRLSLPKGTRGRVRCDVVTVLGQVVGSAEVTIGE